MTDKKKSVANEDDKLPSDRSAGEIKASEELLIAKAANVVAETQKILEETANIRQYGQLTTLQIAQTAVQTRATERLENETLANSFYHHVYHFVKPVDGAAVRECMAKLDIWHRTAPDCDMEISFSSPGGSVIDGLALYDYIQQMKAEGHHFTTSTIGMAASMAGVLLQAGHERIMGTEAFLLVHEITSFTGGKPGEIEDEFVFIKKMQNRILTIFAARCKLSKPELERRWKRKDWWLDSTEALSLGFVDKVR